MTAPGRDERPAASEVGSLWSYTPLGVAVGVLLALLGGVRTHGLQNLPRSGPIILVGNHVALVDPLVAGWGTCWQVGRVVHIISKAEMRRWPLLGWLGSGAGVIYVRRGEGDRDAQRRARAVLAAGRALLLFPEGTRTRTGGLIPARNGAALLAMRSGAPIVPVALTGTERMLTWWSPFGPRPRAEVRIGAPFSLPHRPEGVIDRADLVDGTTRLMRELAALLPPARRGVYG